MLALSSLLSISSLVIMVIDLDGLTGCWISSLLVSMLLADASSWSKDMSQEKFGGYLYD